jgi:acetoin utilization deacetylase AcuC-like enzyme/formylglycine-generating enzyme required for sulfatase activity
VSLRPMLLILSLLAIAAGGCATREQPDSDGTAPSAAPATIRTKTGIEMALIPAGEFLMGDDRGEEDERPAHRVELDAFSIDVGEVTQESFQAMMGRNPAKSVGAEKPVERVSWYAAIQYCNMRSAREGFKPCYDLKTQQCDFSADGYRLPTEAEWEYACRAGTKTRWSFGDAPAALGKHAWSKGNSTKCTHPVRQKQPNPWGLYDMYGNVAEWCNDFYADHYDAQASKDPHGPASGKERVLRGGSWDDDEDGCRSSARHSEPPGFADVCFGYERYGFRCVRRAGEGSEGGGARGAGRGARVEERGVPTSVMAVLPTFVVAGLPTVPPQKTGLVYDDIYLKHDTGQRHPERPQRLTAIVQRLKATGLMEQLTLIPPVPADPAWLATIHAPEYLTRIAKRCAEGTGYVDSRDTPVSAESYRVARAAVGGVLAAVDAVMEGKVANAVCAVRPPGHHATRDKAMGFCLLGNVAIAARYLQKKHKLAKVLIVDWDVHHGNGTQAAFYDDPGMMYFSVHRHPFYPGTGAAAETGAGKAVGHTINVPLPAGSGDREYQEAFEKKLLPAAMAFQPDFVLVSAGFDAHEGDPRGGMKVTAGQYAKQTQIVKQIAGRCCRGRLVSVLEGGYGLEGLAASVEAHVRELMK